MKKGCTKEVAGWSMCYEEKEHWKGVFDRAERMKGDEGQSVQQSSRKSGGSPAALKKERKGRNEGKLLALRLRRKAVVENLSAAALRSKKLK